MKKITYFLVLVLLSLCYISCNNELELEDESQNAACIHEREYMYIYGPLMFIQFHDKEGRDILKEHKYVKYPLIGLEEFIDGFETKYYLNGELVPVQEHDTPVYNNQEMTFFARGGDLLHVIELGDTAVYRRTFNNCFDKYNLKAEMKNSLVFGDTETHTIEFSFQRIDLDNTGNDATTIGELSRINRVYCEYTDCYVDGKPTEITYRLFDGEKFIWPDMIDIIIP